MLAKLVLLLPTERLNRRTAGSVSGVVLTEDDGTNPRHLFEEFLQVSENWSNRRAEPQRSEILDLLDLVVDRGVAGLHLRNEGVAGALPEDRVDDALGHQLLELQDSADLTGLPALRLYCTTSSGHLILLAGAIKTTDQVYEASKELLTAFNLANALCTALLELTRTGRLRNGGRVRRFDLGRLGEFSFTQPNSDAQPN